MRQMSTASDEQGWPGVDMPEASAPTPDSGVDFEAFRLIEFRGGRVTCPGVGF